MQSIVAFYVFEYLETLREEAHLERVRRERLARGIAPRPSAVARLRVALAGAIGRAQPGAASVADS